MSTKLTLQEINKQLDKKNLDPTIEKSLKDKKRILTDNKEVRK
jgi:hypothetical protein